MTTLTLTEILSEPRQWSPKDNPERIFNSYRVKDDKGVVYEINRKASSPPPELGTGEYEVTPAKGDFPPKLKKVFAGGGGGGRSPRDSRRIERQHSQEMAVRLLAAFEPVLEGRTAKTYLPLVKMLTDWFVADLDNAGSGLGGSRGDNGAEGDAPKPPPRSAAESSAASPARKGQTSKKLNALGIDPETQRQLVHAFAGNPPTEAGLDAIDAALEAQDYATLFDEQGIQRPAEIPDMRDLAPVVPDDSTIL